MCNIDIKNIYWTKKDCSKIRILEMDDSHIINTINLCKRNDMEDWCLLFNNELERRSCIDYNRNLLLQIAIEDIYYKIHLENESYNWMSYDPMFD